MAWKVPLEDKLHELEGKSSPSHGFALSADAGGRRSRGRARSGRRKGEEEDEVRRIPWSPGTPGGRIPQATQQSC